MRGQSPSKEQFYSGMCNPSWLAYVKSVLLLLFVGMISVAQKELQENIPIRGRRNSLPPSLSEKNHSPVLWCQVPTGAVVPKQLSLYPMGPMSAIGGTLGEWDNPPLLLRKGADLPMCLSNPHWLFASADLRTSVLSHMAQHEG